MSWAEYHRGTVVTFIEQVKPYRDLIANLKHVDPNILDSGKTQTIVLGGFHGSKSVLGFNVLCELIKVGPQRRVFVDISTTPLGLVDAKDNPNRVQADLQQPPFLKGSVDLLFLDYTTDFMENESVSRLSKNMNELLSTSGIILAAFNDYGDINAWYRLFERIQQVVPTYMRSYEQLCALAAPLKPVAKEKFSVNYLYSKQSTLVALARRDSSLPLIS